MAKLSARGRTELFRMHGSFPAENREAVYVFLSDGKTLYKYRSFGGHWSGWNRSVAPMAQEATEKRLIELGYKRI